MERKWIRSGVNLTECGKMATTFCLPSAASHRWYHTPTLSRHPTFPQISRTSSFSTSFYHGWTAILSLPTAFEATNTWNNPPGVWMTVCLSLGPYVSVPTYCNTLIHNVLFFRSYLMRHVCSPLLKATSLLPSKSRGCPPNSKRYYSQIIHCSALVSSLLSLHFGLQRIGRSSHRVVPWRNRS